MSIWYLGWCATATRVFARPRRTAPATVRARNRPRADVGLAKALATTGASAVLVMATWMQAASAAEASHDVFLFPSASQTLRQGFVRVINHSGHAGEVQIEAIDDTGMSQSVSLSLSARKTAHFNSGDLEDGNAGKGLTGSTGPGTGDWRLVVSSDLDVEVLSYIRTPDGFLTAMHDVAPDDGIGLRIATFNPGSNDNQKSLLRLVNPGESDAEVTVEGVDDEGQSPGTDVKFTIPAGVAETYSAAQLESGDSDLSGALDDGTGKWRLTVTSGEPVVAMSLLESPKHLTNLSTVPAAPSNGIHVVPLFPAANDPSKRQGFVRVVNRTDTAGDVRIQAFDDSQRDYEAITLTVDPGKTQAFNSDDLEQGNAGKGLSGGVGAGEGDWRLELTSDLDIDVLPYIRTEDGFLTSMLDVLPSAGNRHRAAIFNPGSNRDQASLLRLVNSHAGDAQVSIQGIDDAGNSGDSAVWFSVPARGSRTVGADELESGGGGLSGALGDGSGKWQLIVNGDRLLIAMSLLWSPTGHLTNLSTAPVRGAMDLPPEPSSRELAAELFRSRISEPIVQAQCVSCHVNNGDAGETRLVFVPETNANHESVNLKAFEDFLAEVDGGTDLILDKIQGVEHDGGILIVPGSEDYVNLERFLGLLRGSN